MKRRKVYSLTQIVTVVILCFVVAIWGSIGPFADYQAFVWGGAVVVFLAAVFVIGRQKLAIDLQSETGWATLQSLPTPVAILNENGLVEVLNDAWQQFAKQDAAPSLMQVEVGVDYVTLCQETAVAGDPTGAQLQTAIQAIIEGEQSEYQLEYQATPAIWFQVSLSSGPYNNITIIKTDITTLKTSADNWRLSANQYRWLIDNATDVISRHSLEGTYQYASPATRFLLGYDPDELVGRNAYEFFHPQDLQAIMKSHATIREHPIIQTVQYRIQCKDGTYTWFETTSRTVRHPETDEPHQIIAFSRDITERRQIEQDARQVQKMESLGRLAGSIAHDFNNLLVGMLAQTSLGLAKLRSENPAHTHIEKAVEATKRASDLTRQLLTYSGRDQYEYQPVSLNTLIVDNLKLFQVAMPKNVQLQLELADYLPLIEADLGQIHQVMMNLIINAAEAFEGDSGMVLIKTDTQEINHLTEIPWQFVGEQPRLGLYVTLSVQDNGRGIDAQILAKIFDPFFSTKFTGRGLGLAVVQGVLRSHRGGIMVESKEGKGTLLRAFFPASSMMPYDAEPPPQTAVSLKKTSGIVLVIDDEVAVREAASDILQLSGIEVITAADGQTGVRRYQEKQSDIKLVLLDLSMPGLSGEDTFSKLREIRSDLPILLSSGYSETEVNRRFAHMHVVDFLQKPYDANMLVEKIQAYL